MMSESVERMRSKRKRPQGRILREGVARHPAQGRRKGKGEERKRGKGRQWEEREWEGMGREEEGKKERRS
jgi:hypothetical protein